MKEQLTNNNNKVPGGDVTKTLSVTIDRGRGPEKYSFLRNDLWKAITSVINDLYHRQGFRLTLRQLYYQLVGRDLIPNADKMYKLLGRELGTMRKLGLIDWSAIEDRGRPSRKAYYEESVAGALQRTLDSFCLDGQKDQPIHIEVMAEKDAVSSVINPICSKYHIRYTVNKGYSSATAIKDAYFRIHNALNEGRLVRILYLGDHDPSGMDMRDDIKRRVMEMLLCGENDLLRDTGFDEEYINDWAWNNDVDAPDEGDGDYPEYVPYVNYKTPPIIEKFGWQFVSPWQAYLAAFIEEEAVKMVDVAVTMQQIRDMGLPPNPAKLTDSRAAAYVAAYGYESWELDAVAPRDMQEILEEAILEHLDSDVYEATRAKEKESKAKLRQMINDLSDE